MMETHYGRFCEVCGRPLFPDNKGFRCPYCNVKEKDVWKQTKLLQW